MSTNDKTQHGNKEPTIKLGIDEKRDGGKPGSSGHKKKRIAIAIAICMVIAVCGTGLYMLRQGSVQDNDQQASQSTSASDNGNNANANNANANVGTTTGTSTVTTNIGTQQTTNNGNASSNTSTNTESTNYADADNGGPRKSGISNVTMARQQKEDEYMATVDTTTLGNTASAFMRTFLTFDQSSLSSGSWRTGCMAYVDYAQMTDDTNKDGVMYKRLYDDSWARYASKSPTYYGQVQSVTVNSVYATTADDGTITPIADVNVVCDECDGEPGTSPWWDRVMRKNVNYLVHFDTSGKVVSVGSVGSTTLQEIRSSQWREDTTGAQ